MQREDVLRKAIESKDVKSLSKYYFDIDLTPKQVEIVRTISFCEHKRSVISAMTRYGKSYSVGIGIVLFLLFNKNKRVVCVSPTYGQSQIVMQYVIRFLLCNTETLTLIDTGREGIQRLKKQVSQTRITFKNGCEIKVLSAEGRGERLMGFGADLLILDESCLISAEVYKMRISRMLGDNPDSILVEIGNPFDRSSHMYDHWIDENYYHIHIGWQDALTEGRTTTEFIDFQRRDLPEQMFTVLYDAEFPEDTKDSLIKFAWVEKAVRKPSLEEYSLKVLGIDVAGGGRDWTVFTNIVSDDNDNWEIENITNFSVNDTMKIVERALIYHSQEQFDIIRVDPIGIGKGVYDQLHQTLGEMVKKGHFGEKSGKGLGMHEDKTTTKLVTTYDSRMTFINQKSEQYFRLRELFEYGRIKIPDHKQLKKELLGMKYENPNNRVKILDPGEKVEGKTIAGGKKSPDFADSLVYAIWKDDVVESAVYM